MLDEQFNTNPDYYEFVNKNFVAMHFLRRDSGGPEMFELYNVQNTPTVVIAEADGKEIDRIAGYPDPPGKYLFFLKKSFNRIDTFEILESAYNRYPGNLEVSFKLAYKYENDYLDIKQAKKLYKEIVDEADNAKYIMVPYYFSDALISVLEWALYRLGRIEHRNDNKNDYLKMLINEFPDTRLGDEVYISIAPYLVSVMPDTSYNAGPYFEKMLEKYPENENILNWYVISLNTYAWFWAQEGKNLESALDAVKKSIELESDQYNWDTLSLVYWKMGKYKEAIEAEEKALEFAPGTERYLKRIEDIKKDIKKKGGK